MKWLGLVAWSAYLAWGSVACGDTSSANGDFDGAVLDGPTSPVTAMFSLPGSQASDFFDLPWPNDLRRSPDGHIDLSQMPAPGTLIPVYRDSLSAEENGFGLTSAVYFRFSGPLDPTTLPAAAQSLETTSALYLLNIDKDSVNYGSRIPVWTKFFAHGNSMIGDNWLGVLPYPGFILEEATTYAVVLTSRLTDTTGRAILASDDWRSLVAAPSDFAEAEKVYEPLWTTLAEHAEANDGNIINAAVFTTHQITQVLHKAREVVFALPPPQFSVPNDNTTSLYRVLLGQLWLPNFQQGAVPYLASGGGIALNETDTPILQGQHAARIAITLPLGERPAAGWPVVIFGHGTGGSYRSAIVSGLAERLAKVGIATLGFDGLMHGVRFPDGSPELAFFNYFNPPAGRDNVFQGAADGYAIIRMLFRLHLRFPTSPNSPRIDPQKIMYYGHSQGALTGIPFVATEPYVRAAIFSGASGLTYFSLLHKHLPIDIPELVRLVVTDQEIDEFHPALQLVQAYMERSDPAVYAAQLRNRGEDLPHRSIFFTEGLVDQYAPNLALRGLVTAANVAPALPILEPIEGLSLKGIAALSPPVENNWSDGTGVVVQYLQREGSDGHFVAFNIEAAREQTVKFLQSQVETGTAVLPAAR